MRRRHAQIETVDAWDGKDGELPVEDIDLSDVELEPRDDKTELKSKHYLYTSFMKSTLI